MKIKNIAIYHIKEKKNEIRGKNMKREIKKYSSIFFIMTILLILMGGLLNSVLNPDDINYYENRTAYRFSKIKMPELLNKKFQDNTELVFSDQIPLSTKMKQGHKFVNGVVSNMIAKAAFKNNCQNRYFQLAQETTTFDCDQYLVYSQSFINSSINDYRNRIKNINEIIDNKSVEIYIYYIERDTDIDFVTNKKSDMYDYLEKNINSNNIYKFEINNFNEYKEYFYKTDHHWNYKGSYKAYEQIIKFLTGDNPLKYEEEFCMETPFSGSKARYSGAKYFYKEPFCAYKFDFPNYEIYINGKKSSYGSEEYYYYNRNTDISYGTYYGQDFGEVIINNNMPNEQNILIIGESFDNALLKLIASHFNKTYAIDLRNYEHENNKRFKYSKYVTENKIDKVLLIGNRDYYKAQEFNLEG